MKGILKIETFDSHMRNYTTFNFVHYIRSNNFSQRFIQRDISYV